MTLQTKSASTLKELSFVPLLALTVSSMLGSGIFDVPQNLTHNAGTIAILIAWGMTAIGMFAMGGVFIYLITKKPEIQSGIYGYAKYGFGDYIGFNSALGYWLNATLSNVSYLIYIFATLGDFAFGAIFGRGNNLISLIVQSALLWTVAFLINSGIKEAARINTLITILKVSAILFIIFTFMRGFNSHMFLENFKASKGNIGDIWVQVKHTMLVAFWNFTGIEAACLYAMRAKKMQDVARATFFAILISLILDFFISLLPLGILHQGQIAVMSEPSTSGIMMLVNGIYSADFIRVAVIVNVLGALLSWMLLASNIFFLASQDGAIPKRFSILNSKNVPTWSLLVSVFFIQLFLISAYFTSSVYLTMIQLAAFMMVIPYIFSALFAVKTMLKSKEIQLFSLLKGLIAVCYCSWLIYSSGIKYLILSASFYVFGSLIYVLARREQKKSLFSNYFEAIVFVLIFATAISCLGVWIYFKLTGK